MSPFVFDTRTRLASGLSVKVYGRMQDRTSEFDIPKSEPRQKGGKSSESKNTRSIPYLRRNTGGLSIKSDDLIGGKLVNDLWSSSGYFEIVTKIDPAHIFVLHDFVRRA